MLEATDGSGGSTMASGYLPSPATLTGIMEDQIRTELAPLGDLDGFVVDWQWIPAWRPADITDSGRDQLHAIGFTI
jgi:metal-sulfur cluster biosynthetic enzyme